MFTIQLFEEKTGRPAADKKVGIIFHGLLRGGTKNIYTDCNGEAHFDYDNGRGTVYVNGRAIYDGEISGRKILYI